MLSLRLVTRHAARALRAQQCCMSTFKDEYDEHVAERAEQGIVPEPLGAEQMADLVKELEKPEGGEEAFLVDLLENRVPPGVDEAACVSALAARRARGACWSARFAAALAAITRGRLSVLPPPHLIPRPHAPVRTAT